MSWKGRLFFSFSPLFLAGFFLSQTVEAGEVGRAEKINLNTATEEALAAIDVVSPEVARDIINFRRAHGPFRHLRTLLRVPGMTPALLDRIGVYTDIDGETFCPSPPGAETGDEWEEEPDLTVPKC